MWVLWMDNSVSVAGVSTAATTWEGMVGYKSREPFAWSADRRKYSRSCIWRLTTPRYSQLLFSPQHPCHMLMYTISPSPIFLSREDKDSRSRLASQLASFSEIMARPASGHKATSIELSDSVVLTSTLFFLHLSLTWSASCL